MNPSTGTFITMDEYAGSIFEPVSLHKYLYANANPVMYSDPSGYKGEAAESFSLKGLMKSLAINSIITELYTAASATARAIGARLISGLIMGFGAGLLMAPLLEVWIEICDIISSGLASSSTFASETFDTIIDNSLPSNRKKHDNNNNDNDKGWIIYRPLDEYGRATGAMGYITPDMIKTDSSPSTDPTGHIKGINYDRGHLIASVLGGAGNDARNLVPIHQHYNRGFMRKIEKSINEDVADGANTFMLVTPHYNGSDTTPEYLIMFTSNSNGTNIYKIPCKY